MLSLTIEKITCKIAFGILEEEGKDRLQHSRKALGRGHWGKMQRALEHLKRR